MLALGRKPIAAGHRARWCLLETIAWFQIGIFQWVPWIVPYALEDYYFKTGLAIGVAWEGVNIIYSYVLWKVGYLQAWPKMIDIAFLLAVVPLLIAACVGGQDVSNGCWRWFQLVINAVLAATFLISVALPFVPGLSVMEQYMRDLEGGPPRLFKDKYWIAHNYWLNVLWFIVMLGMTGATIEVGLKAETHGTSRTLPHSAYIAEYPIQCGIFGVGLVLNVCYTIYMRPKYLKAVRTPPDAKEIDKHGQEIEAQAGYPTRNAVGGIPPSSLNPMHDPKDPAQLTGITPGDNINRV